MQSAGGIQVLRDLRVHWVRDDVWGLSAELAYRFFLSIFPFFIFLAALGNLLTDWLALPNPAPHFGELLSQVMPPEAAGLFQAELAYVVETTRAGLVPLSLVGALVVATGSTTALMKATNRAFGVEETRPFMRRYLQALALTLLAGAGVLVAFLLLVGSQWFGRQLTAPLGI